MELTVLFGAVGSVRAGDWVQGARCSGLAGGEWDKGRGPVRRMRMQPGLERRGGARAPGKTGEGHGSAVL